MSRSPPCWWNRFIWWKRIETKQDRLTELVQQLRRENAQMALDVKAEVARLTQEVAEERGATQSLVVLVRGFKSALDAALANSADEAELRAALSGLSDSLDANQAEIAQAVAENPLPAETPAPTPGEPTE